MALPQHNYQKPLRTSNAPSKSCERCHTCSYYYDYECDRINYPWLGNTTVQCTGLDNGSAEFTIKAAVGPRKDPYEHTVTEYVWKIRSPNCISPDYPTWETECCDSYSRTIVTTEPEVTFRKRDGETVVELWVRDTSDGEFFVKCDALRCEESCLSWCNSDWCRINSCLESHCSIKVRLEGINSTALGSPFRTLSVLTDSWTGLSKFGVYPNNPPGPLFNELWSYFEDQRDFFFTADEGVVCKEDTIYGSPRGECNRDRRGRLGDTLEIRDEVRVSGYQGEWSINLDSFLNGLEIDIPLNLSLDFYDSCEYIGNKVIANAFEVPATQTASVIRFPISGYPYWSYPAWGPSLEVENFQPTPVDIELQIKLRPRLGNVDVLNGPDDQSRWEGELLITLVGRRPYVDGNGVSRIAVQRDYLTMFFRSDTWNPGTSPTCEMTRTDRFMPFYSASRTDQHPTASTAMPGQVNVIPHTPVGCYDSIRERKQELRGDWDYVVEKSVDLPLTSYESVGVPGEVSFSYPPGSRESACRELGENGGYVSKSATMPRECCSGQSPLSQKNIFYESYLQEEMRFLVWDTIPTLYEGGVRIVDFTPVGTPDCIEDLVPDRPPPVPPPPSEFGCECCYTSVKREGTTSIGTTAQELGVDPASFCDVAPCSDGSHESCYYLGHEYLRIQWRISVVPNPYCPEGSRIVDFHSYDTTDWDWWDEGNPNLCYQNVNYDPDGQYVDIDALFLICKRITCPPVEDNYIRGLGFYIDVVGNDQPEQYERRCNFQFAAPCLDGAVPKDRTRDCGGQPPGTGCFCADGEPGYCSCNECVSYSTGLPCCDVDICFPPTCTNGADQCETRDNGESCVCSDGWPGRCRNGTCYNFDGEACCLCCPGGNNPCPEGSAGLGCECDDGTTGTCDDGNCVDANGQDCGPDDPDVDDCPPGSTGTSCPCADGTTGTCVGGECVDSDGEDCCPDGDCGGDVDPVVCGECEEKCGLGGVGCCPAEEGAPCECCNEEGECDGGQGGIGGDGPQCDCTCSDRNGPKNEGGSCTCTDGFSGTCQNGCCVCCSTTPNPCECFDLEAAGIDEEDLFNFTNGGCGTCDVFDPENCPCPGVSSTQGDCVQCLLVVTPSCPGVKCPEECDEPVPDGIPDIEATASGDITLCGDPVKSGGAWLVFYKVCTGFVSGSINIRTTNCQGGCDVEVDIIV